MTVRVTVTSTSCALTQHNLRESNIYTTCNQRSPPKVCIIFIFPAVVFSPPFPRHSLLTVKLLSRFHAPRVENNDGSYHGEMIQIQKRTCEKYTYLSECSPHHRHHSQWQHGGRLHLLSERSSKREVK